jgi:CPA1 family monovalent cation:H+ antiporter
LTEHLGAHGASRQEVGEAHASHEDVHRRALGAARSTVLAMRDRDEIGDDAFHLLEEELDRVEVGI